MFFIKFEGRISILPKNFYSLGLFKESKSKRHKPLLLLVLFFSKICGVKITTTKKRLIFLTEVLWMIRKSQNFFSIVGYDQGGRSIDGVG